MVAAMNTAVAPKIPSRLLATKNNTSGPRSRMILSNGLIWGFSDIEATLPIICRQNENQLGGVKQARSGLRSHLPMHDGDLLTQARRSPAQNPWLRTARDRRRPRRRR